MSGFCHDFRKLQGLSLAAMLSAGALLPLTLGCGGGGGGGLSPVKWCSKSGQRSAAVPV